MTRIPYQNISLFNSLSETQIQFLLKSNTLTIKKFKYNETILLAGTNTEYFGVVLDGTVQILHEDFQGNRTIVGESNQFDTFAEVFVTAQTNLLPVSVIATSDSTILFVNYHRLIAEHGVVQQTVTNNMLHLIARKCLKLNQKLELLSQKTTREKIIYYLNQQQIDTNSNSFQISFNRQHLADYLNVNRSALSIEMSKMKKEQLIDFQKINLRFYFNKVRILCYNALFVKKNLKFKENLMYVKINIILISQKMVM